METAVEVVEYVTRAGLAVILIVLIVGGARGTWVYKREVDELRQDRDRWRTQAEQAITMLVKHELDEAERRE